MKKVIFTSSLLLTALIFASPVFAQSADIGKVESFIKTIVSYLTFLAGSVAAGFLVYGGFKYMGANDNPEHLDGAKRTIANSLIGLVIVIAAYVIMQIVSSAAKTAFGG
ncbi:hypothetical protein A3C59_04375 [Candidatus Daviesbacteria bacterium RIFCSPHIGHO2_02_FULL_36_13]|uniref:DUF4134 domain-containing protein n=1 Tax=Candidatus Daviesbacteria bacterium RIFCSPHIGHO2_02_FULL_36_13 TaxID=1797768 RepID=A0A1F5JWA2_9BACT|nr:MAG: hypothetical protein A3C59_04375 [Candidatus Daviesbacteria bacterium RIFCSPHIGHO2_02_FULL_36_13]OGE40908.1 MAG: hypothetical protein A3A45_01155 [Candidatus Daviesbacteria bacterium RIFCSPLOWO2_01_FULL_36_8]